MSDEPIKQCVKCGQEVRRLIFGGAGIIFKGSGFYVTDKGSAKTVPASKKKETKSAAESSTGNSGGGTESSAAGQSKTSTEKSSDKTA